MWRRSAVALVARERPAVEACPRHVGAQICKRRSGVESFGNVYRGTVADASHAAVDVGNDDNAIVVLVRVFKKRPADLHRLRREGRVAATCVKLNNLLSQRVRGHNDVRGASNAGRVKDRVRRVQFVRGRALGIGLDVEVVGHVTRVVELDDAVGFARDHRRVAESGQCDAIARD